MMNALGILPARLRAVPALGALFFVFGCGDMEKLLDPATFVPADQTDSDRPAADEPEAADGKKEQFAGRDEGRDERPVERAQSAEENQTAAPVATQPPKPVRLSAGAALPQSLPTGTGMSFSVDYQFLAGQPNPSNRYVWLIERSRGDRLARQFQPKREGNLVVILPGWRPEEGPFQSYIVEVAPNGTRRRISNAEPLR